MEHILILGGTGKTGRRIVRRLRSAGLPVRAASRTGADVYVDLDNAPTWTPALDGVTAVYAVVPTADPQDALRVARFLTEAAAAGVRRMVLLTAGGVDQIDGHPLRATEQAVRGSGVDWTILRPTWFAQNFSEAFWLPGIREGILSVPTGDGQVPFVDAEDIAEIAASALTEDRHSGQAYQLTGPRAISFGEAADLIGKATGRTIRHADVDPEVYVQRQVEGGVPAEMARLLAGLFTGIRAGEAAAVSDGVERALGKPERLRTTSPRPPAVASGTDRLLLG